jgi:proline dehydrogenase
VFVEALLLDHLSQSIGWVCRKYFHVDDDDDTSINKIFEEYDPDHTGKIDYIMWSMMLDLKDLPKITAACKDVGPLAMAAPTDEEIELIEAMYTRGHVLANEAARVGTRLLIDAEQVRYQPAIDKLVFDLQRTYNTVGEVDKPIVYNTYQCYLKDVSERLDVDVKRAERFGYHFGAKLVRGAYMESENELAKKQGIPSPIHDSIEDTHKSYDDSVDQLLLHSTTSDKQVEVMCATHNQSSIEKAIESMNLHNIDRKSSTICFAQLYGMSDHLSFNLGKHGYRAYKYLPYGEVAEVMPYLLRRANENSAILGATASELDMIQSELKRRIQTKLKMNS